MTRFQRLTFSLFYSIFNRILPVENDVRAEIDFNVVVKYLFDFEVELFESVKLYSNKISIFDNFQKFPLLLKFSEMALLICPTTLSHDLVTKAPVCGSPSLAIYFYIKVNNKMLIKQAKLQDNLIDFFNFCSIMADKPYKKNLAISSRSNHRLPVLVPEILKTILISQIANP